ncbi:multiple sugar transport system substrate-binding protein [Microbacterium foliorum]|uniref:Multiple sugar transport system substrate-binding protein n=1 Tax=Microbacterium foliorum TaxID=104336 RepID=A0ABU1HXN6_9MICO|nr:sugar ABC transporter substrate-binding protein [Microbacterium foliorum]MDR6144019.1 multiple sugar transport system substrate-binding protein [Microbacterium foliorum]
MTAAANDHTDPPPWGKHHHHRKEHSMNRRLIVRSVAASVATALIGVSLAACAGSATDTSGEKGADAVEKALAEGGKITFWSWSPSAESQVAAFEKAYPNVDVEFVNSGGAGDSNLKLQNALAAGKGAPDVVQLEYMSVPQFVLADAFVDLTDYGFADLEDQYTESSWANVSQGGIWGLPQDSGPMALFYNQATFDKFGLTVPSTWDEYIDAARTLHAADPEYFITNDSGLDGGLGSAMLWQAGSKAFQVDGDTVTVDLEDEGAQRYADTWGTLVKEGLVDDIAGWSDEWFDGLSSGKIATLAAGAWMPGVLESGAADSAGDWRVAPMPTYDGGEPATAENGGSTEAVTKQSENPALAAGFLKWLNSSDESVDIFVGDGGFPATIAHLESSEFLDAEPEFFGGQQINKVLVDAAKSVVPGWQYLPWQAYANSVYGDAMGPIYANRGSIAEGLKAWQDANVTYGEAQGFTLAE